MIMEAVLILGMTIGAGEATKGNWKAGQSSYETYCATCHGKTGKGDGPSAASLTPKPANHTDKKLMSTLSNEEIFKTIKEGGASVGKSPLMPAWGASLNDGQIHDLVAFIRHLCRCEYKPVKK